MVNQKALVLEHELIHSQNKNRIKLNPSLNLSFIYQIFKKKMNALKYVAAQN